MTFRNGHVIIVYYSYYTLVLNQHRCHYSYSTPWVSGYIDVETWEKDLQMVGFSHVFHTQVFVDP